MEKKENMVSFKVRATRITYQLRRIYINKKGKK